MRYLAVGLVALILLAVLIWASRRSTGESPLPNLPLQAPSGDYVGSAACKTCHSHQHSSWHDSYHRTMTQTASETSIFGDFNDVQLAAANMDVRLFKENGRHLADVRILKPEQRTVFPVVMTTGSHHRQVYWLADPSNAQLRALPYMYLKDERRWIPRHAGYLGTAWKHPTPEVAQFEGEYGRWAAVCIQCHTTYGRPMPEPDVAETLAIPQVAEFGISCESCHGPGAAHASAPAASPLVNPSRLTHDRSSHVCGQCHSVFFHRSKESHQEWLNTGFAFRPGDDLMKDRNRFLLRGTAARMKDKPTHVPDPVEYGAFWPDGMIRVTGREFSGMMESPCYQRGELSCLSCHQMHQGSGDTRGRSEWAAGQLKPGMDGPRACTQCHDAYKDSARVAQHTHHAADSPGANCYNCHMPNTTYGILKATRSHQISSPAAGDSTARPNACNLCHLDRAMSWTARNLEQWYRIPKPKLPADEEKIAASVLWLLRGDAGQRAIAAWSCGWPEAHRASGGDWQAPFLAHLLDDPYDAVRYVSQKSLKKLPGFRDFDYDYVGPPANRAAAPQRARHQWEEARTKHVPSAAILIGGDGRIQNAEILRLLKLRDDRPIDLSE